MECIYCSDDNGNWVTENGSPICMPCIKENYTHPCDNCGIELKIKELTIMPKYKNNVQENGAYCCNCCD